MKLSTIAKTSLALGILTTGVMTTYAQSVDAAVSSIQNQYSPETLLEYYNRTGHDLRNFKGYRDGDKVNVTSDRAPLTEVKVSGSDKSRYLDENLKDIDVFVVRENNTSRESTTQSIGGITKPNSQRYIDHVAKVPFNIERTNNNSKSIIQSDYKIYKEEISLKELDFKLRKELIKNQDLYKNGKNNGTIVVKMQGNNENDKYTFELDKKLQDHRMGDVIDSRKIEKITVSL
ncbi:superantigen-like protein [Staphylococcus hyicus]|uniref:exotoxin beta-grasp domain-containing protein n=1 Tax=Staphylococcus hyicus TaxID=1284 RepID=UPI00273832BD|nr:superantigen-like protein [Staphylococcus hyicus]MDP4460580.1 superantigen-like protein [Staphylococcus hyicus]